MHSGFGFGEGDELINFFRLHASILLGMATAICLIHLWWPDRICLRLWAGWVVLLFVLLGLNACLRAFKRKGGNGE